MRHNTDHVDMFSYQDMIFCFQSRFQRIHSCTVLMDSALTLFRCPDRALSSTVLSSLQCLIAR
jgi:hypothetical protein